MASKAEQARMKAGDIVQYRKVGKARLVERSDFDRRPESSWTQRWRVEFITGPKRVRTGEHHIWINDGNVIERA
jgi:hypothetical protein